MDLAGELLSSYVTDDRAATAIEYGLIASIISIATAIVVLQIGASLQTIFQQAADGLS